jgi:hypothetical protein
MDKQTRIKTGIVIACLLLAMVITVYNRGGGTNRPVYVACANPGCTENSYQVSADQLRKMMQTEGPAIPGHIILQCINCEKNTGQVAQKCSKCEMIFALDTTGMRGYADTCSHCGYSETRERVENYKK